LGGQGRAIPRVVKVSRTVSGIKPPRFKSGTYRKIAHDNGGARAGCRVRRRVQQIEQRALLIISCRQSMF